MSGHLAKLSRRSRSSLQLKLEQSYSYEYPYQEECKELREKGKGEMRKEALDKKVSLGLRSIS